MDAVQRKLELIDKQLAGRDVHKKIISTAPLLFVVTGLIAGILIQNTSGLPIWFWLILLALCATATITIFAIQKETAIPYITAYAVLACFVCLGAVRLTSYEQPQPNDIRNSVADERELATIRGLIVTEPYINNKRDWEFAKFRFTDPGSSFYLKVYEVKAAAESPLWRNGWAKAAGTVRVQVAEPVLDLKAGDYIQAYCWLDRFRPPQNPGQFDTARYLARKNVFIAASVKSRDGIEILRSAQNDKWSGIYTKIKRRLRNTATQALVGELSVENPNRGLLEALLLGYRGNIDSDTYRAFRKTGLLHFISLSGMHFGIFVGIIWWLCRTAGLMKPARAIICIIAIVIFLLIVPPRAPTVRAAVIGLVFCASFLFRRRFNSLNILSLAAIILLLIRPTGLFEAGWQLSFASVLGLVLFCERIHFFLYEKIPNWPWRKESPKTKPFFRIISRPGPYLLRLFSTGLTAWLGGAGILLYHFYTINPLTCIWTVIAFPFVAAILTVGFLKIILSLLLPSAATVLSVIVNGLSSLLIWIVELIASWHIGSWDISQILIGRVSLALVILYYCLIFFTVFVYFRRPLTKKAICTAGILVIICFLGITKWQRTHRDNLAITCLDVGHGQAILARLPGGANVLFDAGSLYNSNIGQRIVATYLDYSGISRIDLIIISHNDVDHINGIPEVVDHCRIGGVYANDAFFSKTDKWGTARFLDESLSEKGLKIQPLDSHLNLSSTAKIKILWPSEQIGKNEELSDNDKSLVSLIEFAGRKILLCSDITKFAQRELLQSVPNLKSEVVVVPHHGSAKTSDADFLESLDADILICSCGRGQYEKRQVIKQKNNLKLFYTPRDGAVTVCIDKDGQIKTDLFVKQNESPP